MATTSAGPMPRSEALAVAERFCTLLTGAVERVEIAGSIRRRALVVNDIEIVAVPAIEQMTERDLFGEIVTTTPVDLLSARMESLVDHGTVSPRPRADGRIVWGPRARLLWYDERPIDLFTPDADRFGWILALRTGPAAYSTQLVTPLGARNRYGRLGLLPPAYKPRDGWLTRAASAERMLTPNERDVFDLFGLTYLHPWERS